MSAALMFTSVVPANAQAPEELLLDEEAGFAEVTEEDFGFAEETDELNQLTALVDGNSITFYGTVTAEDVAEGDYDWDDTATVTGGAIAAPAWAGHTLSGSKWYSDEGRQTEVSDLMGLTNGNKVYGLFTLDSYTITYHRNYSGSDTTVAARTENYGDHPAGPSTAFEVPEGKVLSGWATAADGAAKDLTYYTISNATDYYAIWEEIPPVTTYTVTFNSMGGSAVSSIPVAAGDTVTKPADPTKLGFTFGGWYKEESCSTAFKFRGESSPDPITGNITLYAKWNATHYAIKYHQILDDVKTDLNATDPAYVYVVKTLATGADTTGLFEWDGTAFVSAVSATAVATVTYYEKIELDPSYDNGDEITLPAYSVIDASFVGWYRDAQCTNPVGSSNKIATTALVGQLDVYAKFTAQSIEVKYIANTAANTKFSTISYASKKPSIAKAGVDLEISVPTRDNFKCDSVDVYLQATDPDFEHDTAIATITTTGKTTFKVDKDDLKNVDGKKLYIVPNWTNKTYDITYNLDGGSKATHADYTWPTTFEVEGSDTTIILRAPEKAYYDFDGWYSNSSKSIVVPLKSGETDVWEYTIKTADTKGVTFYAKWKEKANTTYKNITYNHNGGTKNELNPTRVALKDPDASQTIKFYAPTRTGYKFKGWYKKASLDSAEALYQDTDTDGTTPIWTYTVNNATINAGIVLYAAWELDDFEVFFYSNDAADFGTAQSATGKYGSKVSALELYNGETFSRTNYELTGWYIGKETKDATVPHVVHEGKMYAPSTDLATTSTTIAGTTVLFAKWEGATQTITFVSNYPTAAAAANTSKLEVKAGATFTVPKNPFAVPDGFKFKGWTAIKANAVEGGTPDNANWKPEDKKVADFYSYTDSETGEVHNNEIIVYAVWDITSYTIIFDMGDAPSVDDSSFPITTEALNYNGADYSYHGYKTVLKAGDEFQLTGQEFVREGYSLDGWTLKSGGSLAKDAKIQTLTNTNNAVVKLTAKWKLNSYGIKFETNGGKFATKELQEDVYTLKSYKVTDAAVAAPITIPGTNGTGTVVATDIEKEGYDFIGWYLDAAFENPLPSAKQKVGVGYALYSATLYAKYDKKSYTFTIKSDDAPFFTTSYNYGVSIDIAEVIKATNLKKNGYTLSGFKDAKGKKHTTKEVLKVGNANITLDAIWTANENKVTYALNGGTLKNKVTKFKTGTDLKVKIPTKKGYEFTGWTITPVDTKKPYSTSYTESIGESEITYTGLYGAFKFTANYTPISYEIILTDGNGHFVSDNVAYNAKVNLARLAADLQANSDKEGYAVKSINLMNGKKKQKSYNTKKFYKAADFGKGVLSNEHSVTLTATFSKTKLFNIDYYVAADIDDAEGILSTDTTAYAKTYSAKSVPKITTPKRAGYKFKGWKVDIDEDGTVYTTSAKLQKAIKAQKEPRDIRLTATWEKVEFNVKVVTKAAALTTGAEKVKSGASYVIEGVQYNDTTQTLAINDATAKYSPKWYKDGYAFAGFSTDKAGKKMLTAPTEGIGGLYDISRVGTKKGTVTIYANWKKIELGNTVSHAAEDFVLYIDANTVANSATPAGLEKDSYDVLAAKLAPATALGKKFAAVNDGTKLSFGKTTKLDKPSVEGYTFLGWKPYAADGTTAIAYSEATAKVLEWTKDGKYITAIKAANYLDSFTIQAVFKANTVTLKFNPNGGYYYDSTKDEADRKVTSETEYIDTTGKTVNVDVNLLTAANTANLQTAFVNSSSAIKDVEKNDSVLAGYAYDKAGKQNILKSKYSLKKDTKTVTIYPIWEALEDVEVTDVTTTPNTSLEVSFVQTPGYSYEIQYSDNISFRVGNTYSVVRAYDGTGKYTISNATATPIASRPQFVRVRSVKVNSDKTKSYGNWSVIKGDLVIGM
jgi:uncharacterized repeat protein (TIGR02543 family)